MSAILGNGPQDEKELALVLHKRNPKSHAPGALWRWTLPEEAYIYIYMPDGRRRADRVREGGAQGEG